MTSLWWLCIVLIHFFQNAFSSETEDHVFVQDEQFPNSTELFFSSEILTWTDAKSKCHENEGALVQINTGAVYRAVTKRARETMYNYWTSGYKDTKGSWMWLLDQIRIPIERNRSNREFQHAWYRGLWSEPNGGNQTDVALMIRNLTYNNKTTHDWYDVLQIFPEHYICQKNYVCEEKKVNGFHFGRIKRNQNANSKETCPQGYSEAIMTCEYQEIETSSGPQWTSVFSNNTFAKIPCVDLLKANVSNTNVTTQNAPLLLTAVSTLLKSNSSKDDNEDEAIANILELTSSILIESDEPIKPSTLSTVASITSQLDTEEQSSKLSEAAVTATIELTRKVETPESGIFERSFESLTIKVEETKLTTDTAKAPVFDVSQPNKNDSLSVSIPFDTLKSTEENGVIRVSTVFFASSNLFPSENINTDWVLSIDLGKSSNAELSNLPEPLTIKTGSKKEDTKDVKVMCGFWNTIQKDWDTAGCNLTRDSSKEILCHCYHLTSFAVIFVPQENIQTLSILSKIGCSVTVVALFLTSVIYLFFIKTRNHLTMKIQISIYINLIIAYLIFLLGFERTEIPMLCTAMAASFQYFMLTTWFWMGVYAFKLYRLIVMASVGSSWYMLKASVFSYGFPLLIVASDLCLSFFYFDKTMEKKEDTFGFPIEKLFYRSNDICWLHEFSLYFGFLLFLGIILVANIVFIALITMSSVLKRKRVKSKSVILTKKELTVLATMVVQLGVSWIFGFLLLIEPDSQFNQIFSYVFSALNSFQGLSIFYFACISRNDVFDFWILPIKKIFIQEKPLQASKADSLDQSSLSRFSKFFTKSTRIQLINESGDNSGYKSMETSGFQKSFNSETCTTSL